MFESLKMSLEITIIVHGYHVYKDIWEVEISSEFPFYLSQMHGHEDYQATAILQLF